MDTPHAADPLPPLRRARAFLLALAAVVAAGAVMRAPLLTAWSSSYPLTQVFNGEEVETVRVSTGMLHKRSLNPHQFGYPSLYYYLGLAAVSPIDRAESRSWTGDLLAMRAVSLVFGLGTLVLIGLLGRRLAGDAAGVLAAALAACDRTSIDVSTIAKPNAAQVFFVVAGLAILVSFTARPRVSRVALAAFTFGLAAASKWIGGLGLAALPVAGLLAGDAGRAPLGPRRVWASACDAFAARVPVWAVLVPLIAFGAAFVVSVPYAVLSPREFGVGFAQTFLAQGMHQRQVAWWAPLGFLFQSLGPVGLALVASGLVWAVGRLFVWDGSAEDRGVALTSWWTLKYGFLVLVVFVKLPSYLDLWIPSLAVLAAGAWAGTRGWLRSSRLRWAAAAAALIAGVAWSGTYAGGRVGAARLDTRLIAARTLERLASPDDSVLADLGAYVPEAFQHVRWNSWGSPPRTLYDESATWGRDPVWPEWIGGHRRLVFENAKWQPASVLLAARPRWVVTTDEWERARAMPSGPSESADPDFDRSLADGRAGYILRQTVVPREGRDADSILTDARRQGLGGPVVRTYERVR